MTLVGELGAQVLLMKSSKLHPSCTTQGVLFRQVRAGQGVLFRQVRAGQGVMFRQVRAAQGVLSRQRKVFCLDKSGQLSQNRLLLPRLPIVLGSARTVCLITHDIK